MLGEPITRIARLRRGYHHGNLKEALIDAAIALISAKGPSGFTFAEAARAAGVSPAAPYRHFRDRDALMAEVAQRGFTLFAMALEKAWNGGRPDPTRALDAVGKAYLGFARTEPAYYAAMFESGLPAYADPDLNAASERAFAVLRDAAEAVIAALPIANRPPVTMMALHLWSQAHGIASLFGRADAARRPIPMSPEDLLEAATLVYLRGLV
ncbi:MAG: TetR/AcrR family transcriptional regulator [Proteobacteria bacterium]|nr:TetR/AcrR family transcriptional regulator [Pseudomonadota bacterium]